MPDKQLFTFRMPGRRRRGHHRGQLPGGRALLVPGAGAAVRQRRGVEAGRVRARAGRGAHAALPPWRRCPTACSTSSSPTARPRSRAWSGLSRRGAARQGRVHRLHRGRPAHRRAVRAPPAVAVPGAGRQEPAGRHARRGSRPGRRGRTVQRVRHGRPALHVAGHRDRPRVRARRVPGALHPRRGERGDRRPDAGRPLRPDDPRALPGALPGLAGVDPRPPHGRAARPAPGASPSRTRARASWATRSGACTATRRSSTA